jgi:OmpA-OmpF porin, OOP family
MRTFLALLLAAIALGILAYVCIGQHAPIIANDLNQRATAALAAGNHSFASVEGVNGRDVSLTGEAPTEEAKFAAIRDVDKVWGVRTVIDKMTVAAAAPEPEAPPAAPYLFQAGLAGGVLTLTGAVPSEDVRRAVLANAQANFLGVRVDDQLIVREGAPNAEWPNIVTLGLGQLARLNDGQMKLEDLALSLSGNPKTQGDFTDIDRAIQGLPAPFSGLNNLTAPPAPVADAPAPAAEEPAPPAAAPTPAERTEAQACQREFNRAFRGQTINFDTSSARISRSSQRLLRRLATIAGGCPSARFTIAGHTDNQGAPASNLRLSQARANAVRDALAQLGVRRARMGARGFGEARPIASNRTAQGRAANRRIEFLVR